MESWEVDRFSDICMLTREWSKDEKIEINDLINDYERSKEDVKTLSIIVEEKTTGKRRLNLARILKKRYGS